MLFSPSHVRLPFLKLRSLWLTVRFFSGGSAGSTARDVVENLKNTQFEALGALGEGDKYQSWAYLQGAASSLALCKSFFFGLAAWLVLLSHAAFPFGGYHRPPSSTDCGFDNHISKCRPTDKPSERWLSRSRGQSRG